MERFVWWHTSRLSRVFLVRDKPWGLTARAWWVKAMTVWKGLMLCQALTAAGFSCQVFCFCFSAYGLVFIWGNTSSLMLILRLSVQRVDVILLNYHYCSKDPASIHHFCLELELEPFQVATFCGSFYFSHKFTRLFIPLLIFSLSFIHSNIHMKRAGTCVVFTA